MTLTGALVLLVVGILLVVLTSGVLHLLGIIAAVVGAVGLVVTLLVGSGRLR